MFDVISFGTATYDVFLRSVGMQINDGDICVRYGAKLEVNDIYFDYGGGGTNSAVTFARQGLNVAAVVQMGDDYFGKKICADLKSERIYTDLIDVQRGGYTDYSTILWAPDGGRTVLIYRGKTRLEGDNVAWDKLDTKWVYVASLEGNLEIVEKLSGKIMWNPGGRELKQKEKVLALLPKIAALNLNKEEMEELVGGNEKAEISGLLEKAQTLPCEYIIVTDDKRGAYLWDKKNSVWWKSGVFEDSPRFETLGAGDAFGSGLATGFIKNLPLPDCLYLASANASSVVSMVGAKKGILREKDLNLWAKNKLTIEKLDI